IIMGVPDVTRLLRAARGTVVANHLEALSHCPVTRPELLDAAVRAGLADRLLVPEDGESLSFAARRLSSEAQ
ncbi:MBL fold metallo-hydrolase, partial [Halobellus sp. Atlit-31R]